MNRLRVLLLTNLFPTPVDPNRGIFTRQLAAALDPLCDLTVVCPLPFFPKLPKIPALRRWQVFGDVPAVYDVGGQHVHSPKYLMVPRVSEGVHADLMFASVNRLVRTLHARQPFDVINGHWIYPDGVVANRIAERLGIPSVLTALGCDVNDFLEDPSKRAPVVQALRNADRLITVSAALKERILQEEGMRPARAATGSVRADRISVIPNGVDTTLFTDGRRAPARARLGIDGPFILYVGRLSCEKNVSWLIDALAETTSGARLTVVGDGPERSALVDQVGRLGLNDRVRFVGERPHIEVADWLAAADVLCLPSVREGCPNVVLEAQACGTPVVASRVGGLPEMVGPGSGTLVGIGETASLAEALDRALTIRWDRAAIRERALAMGWDGAAREYLAVYLRAAGRDAEPALGELPRVSHG